METKRQWPPAGYESAEEYVTYMTASGLWGSRNYLAWKQLRIQQQALIANKRVSKEFRLTSDVYDLTHNYITPWRKRQ